MPATFVITDLEAVAAAGGYVQHGYYEAGDFWRHVGARMATPRELERWRTEQMIRRGGPKRSSPPWHRG